MEKFHSLVFDQTGVELTKTKYSENIKQYFLPTQKQENVVDSHSFQISWTSKSKNAHIAQVWPVRPKNRVENGSEKAGPLARGRF